jgi:hypothetical protein
MTPNSQKQASFAAETNDNGIESSKCRKYLRERRHFGRSIDLLASKPLFVLANFDALAEPTKPEIKVEPLYSKSIAFRKSDRMRR